MKKREKKLMDLVNEKTESLRKSEAKLLESNASKDKFFSIISHDMKNLFGVLVPFTDILKNEFDILPKERLKEIIDNLNISSKSLYETLNNLLEWARLQTDRIICQPIKINVHETGDKILGFVMENAIKKDIALINQINESTVVSADRNMLESVLQNLIYNAIKFTNQRGQIILSDSLKDDNFIAISVKDSGVGIKKENIHKLFKIDIKHSSIGTADELGTGLGLILCKDMIEKNGGQIWVDSEIGKGTTFTFTLPKG
jgi:signal transduction histidine kinase